MIRTSDRKAFVTSISSVFLRSLSQRSFRSQTIGLLKVTVLMQPI